MTLEETIATLQGFNLVTQTDEALRVATASIVYYPQSGQLHYILGCLYDYLRRHEQAYYHHTQAIRCESQLFNIGAELTEDWQFDEENVPCPVCGSNEYDIVRVVNMSPVSPTYGILNPIRRWVQCHSCRQVYACPRQSVAAIMAYAEHEGANLARVRTDEMMRRALVKERLLFLAKEISQLSVGPHFLDIGASYGTTVAEALKLGWDAWGVEISPDKAGIDLTPEERHRILIGNIDNVSLTPNHYDIITAFDIIEHVPNLQHFVSTIRQALKPGGILFISTPDFTSPKAREEGLQHIMWLACEHLVYFSRLGLINFLKEFGFIHLSDRFSQIISGGLEAVFTLSREIPGPN